MTDSQDEQSSAGPFWLETVEHNGRATYNPDPASYQIYRNVRDFGAVGDGVTDDTKSINDAISSGSRCGEGCDSSTISPALVYFPPGTYLVSSPLISYYYTQLVGSAIDRPTLLAAPTFAGIALIDEDPYLPGGSNWYANQNNFFRAVYNFRIDLTQVDDGTGTGIHHQVSQATGLFNIHFEMRQDAGNQQQGIFMENGSGGFMTKLSFKGGKFGAFLGNQQFTVRSCTFQRCQTAISQLWNWGWTYQDISIEDCTIGFEMRTSPDPRSGAQGVSSVLATDWKLARTETAFAMTIADTGVLVLDNISVEDVASIVVSGCSSDPVVLLKGTSGSSVVNDWVQGHIAAGNGKLQRVQGPDMLSISRPITLTKVGCPNRKWFSRDRPQYLHNAPEDFVNIKTLGCAGDGKTDDAHILQRILNRYAGSKVIFVPHGTYLLETTVTFPVGTKMVGEVWPVLMGGGPLFQDASSPKPVIRVGEPGDVGIMEISDMVFSTRGPAPGAVVVEWNIRQDEERQGSAAMWDSHIRIGGFAGTNLEADVCAREQPLLEEARASFLNLHLTPSSSAYLENVWVWTADHDLDYGEKSQVNVRTGRGILVESRDGPVWMYGGASEHSILYQYNIVNASNVFVGLAQTETAYFQGFDRGVASDQEPLSLERYHDPDFCTSSASSPDSPFADPRSPYENRGLGMRIACSSNIFVYGAGLYSFFDNYRQDQLSDRRCQKRILWIQNVRADARVCVLNLNTVGTEKMLTVDGQDVVDESALRNGFGNSLAAWLSSS